MKNIQDLIDNSGGDLNKAIRAFNRQYGGDDQTAADSFNAIWAASGNRPLKRPQGALLRWIRSGRGKPPAGYCQIN